MKKNKFNIPVNICKTSFYHNDHIHHDSHVETCYYSSNRSYKKYRINEFERIVDYESYGIFIKKINNS